MAREQEACVPAVLRRRPWNQAKKATSTEKRSSFVKLVRWLSMPMTVGAWTSYPINWSAGSDSGCWSESITIAVRAWPSGVGQRLTGDDVVRVLEGVASQRGKPQTIRVDNGPEFISRSLDLWAYSSGVKLDFSRPGKPTDNAFIESFNGRLRDECLNQHWFLSLDEARAVTEAWRDDYNRVRPHGALGNQTPFEFARLVAGHAQLPALHG